MTAIKGLRFNVKLSDLFCAIKANTPDSKRAWFVGFSIFPMTFTKVWELSDSVWISTIKVVLVNCIGIETASKLLKTSTRVRILGGIVDGPFNVIILYVLDSLDGKDFVGNRSWPMPR
jgi:hypothetical protein